MIKALVLAAGLMAAGAAFAAEPTTVAPATAQAPPKGPTYAPPKAADQKDDQVVCKSEPVLGSRLPVRRCHTVAENRERMQNDQDLVAHAQANLQIRDR